MQENEFEKRVREQMDEFSLVPNEAVWKQVEARISGEKKRRLLFWFVGALLLVGGITWWMIESPDNVTRDVSIAKSKPAIITSNITEQQINDTNKIVGSISALTKRSVDDNENANKNKQTYTTIKTDVRSSVNNETPSGNETERVLESKTPVAASSSKPSKLSSVIENESKEIALHKYYKSAEQLKADSLQRALARNKNTASVDTLKVASVIAGMKPLEHKWKLGIAAFGGVSGNTNGIDLISAKSVQAAAFYSFSSASPSTSGAVPVVIPKLTYKRSASYGFGMFAQRQIGKRTAISLGVDYHYFSSKSIVGNRVDSSLNLYDTALQKQTTVQSFYKVGQSTLFSNKYNLIQLPVNLLFRLNKNSSKPLLFSFGLSPSFLIASKALYVNRYQGIYYEEKQQFKNFLLFGQSGLLFTPVDSKKYQLSLGPVVQYDFNSMSKWQTQASKHLTFMGIKSNITFK
jgi:hypothetical protein